MPIEKIRDVTIYPEFLIEEIYHLDEPTSFRIKGMIPGPVVPVGTK